MLTKKNLVIVLLFGLPFVIFQFIYTVILDYEDAGFLFGFFISVIESLGIAIMIAVVVFLSKQAKGQLNTNLADYIRTYLPKTILYTILFCIWVLAGTLLFIIPGIILAIKFLMVPYIVQEHDEAKKRKDIFKYSNELSKGHFFSLCLFVFSTLLVAIFIVVLADLSGPIIWWVINLGSMLSFDVILINITYNIYEILKQQKSELQTS